MRSEHSSRLYGFLGGVAVGSAATMVLVRDALPRLVDRYRSARPAASPVQRPALIINPRSGDGKSQRYGLPDRARELGIAVRVLEHGEDLRQLAREVIDAGADAVGMAGGDGSLGLVAQVAIESDVPFFCVPLGTRNHFALDIGLNRDHPLSALHAVKSGQEIAVDYGLAGDRVFVNNVSFGLYARAVHSEGYRQDKIGTLVAVAKQMAAAPGTGGSVRFAMPDGAAADDAAVLLVSNNRYVWSGPPDFGRRASMDGGELGILSVLSIPRGADVGSLTMRDLRQPHGVERCGTRRPLRGRHDRGRARWGVGHAAGTGGAAVRAGRPAAPPPDRGAARVRAAGGGGRRAAAGPGEPFGGRQPMTPDQPTNPTDAAAPGDAVRPPREPRDAMTATAHDLRPVMADLHDADVAAFTTVADMESPVLDRLLPPLSLAASYSRLWMGISAVLAATGGARGRRTALMGLTAIASTSLVANALVKPMFSRPRPTVAVPQTRRLRQPESSSFPSGHTASAAAFSSVVSSQIPALRVPITALAAAVGFSRVYTGVHYPGDVAVGWVIGRGVAGAVQRCWPTADGGQPSPAAGPAGPDEG